MENNDEFTVHLPSNTRCFTETNTASKYTVKLALPISLSGEWECGLKEIHYPHTWRNITEDESEIYFWWFNLPDGEYKKTVLNLPAGYYESNEELAKGIEETIRGAMTKFTENWRRRLHVGANRFSDKIDIEVPNRVKIGFNEKLASILGFDTKTQNYSEITKGKVRQKYPVSIYLVDALYVYSDILRPNLVGDALVPLLRIVPVTGERGRMSHVEYIKPVYYPVGKQNFSSIEIFITDSAGRPIDFKHGKTTVMLHFRRRKNHRGEKF